MSTLQGPIGLEDRSAERFGRNSSFSAEGFAVPVCALRHALHGREAACGRDPAHALFSMDDFHALGCFPGYDFLA